MLVLERKNGEGIVLAYRGGEVGVLVRLPEPEACEKGGKPITRVDLVVRSQRVVGIRTEAGKTWLTLPTGDEVEIEATLRGRRAAKVAIEADQSVRIERDDLASAWDDDLAVVA